MAAQTLRASQFIPRPLGAAPDARRHWFRAKWRAEEAVRGGGQTWTIIRPTWIYGPGDVSLNRFVGFARRLQMVPMTNTGRQLLAPAFIDDVARLAVDSLTDPAAAARSSRLVGPKRCRCAKSSAARSRLPASGVPSCPVRHH